MRRPRSILKAICRGAVFVTLLAGTANADAAVAYWQTGGTGTPDAQVVPTRSPVRVNQTSSVDALAPGRPAQILSGSFDNRNASPVHVATVTASIAAITKAPTAAAGTCDSSDFTLGHRTITVGADVPSGRGTGAWTGATIAFHNKPGVDQNACMGATVKLRYATS
jgi:hypothetical protein